MKRPLILLIGCLASTALLIAELVSVGGALNPNASDAEVVGQGIGLMLMIPHFVMFGIGIILEWLGYFTRVKGLTLAAGILFCVALALMFTSFIQTGIALILAFVGYAAQRKRANAVAKA